MSAKHGREWSVRAGPKAAVGQEGGFLVAGLQGGAEAMDAGVWLFSSFVSDVSCMHILLGLLPSD